MRTALMLMAGFLGVTAVAGSLGLFTGELAPGVEQLEGSPFGSYTIPALTLLAIGIVSLAGATVMKARHPVGVRIVIAAGSLIMAFETVQVIYIDFHVLQPVYFLLGALMVTFGALLRLEQERARRRSTIERL